MKLHELSVKRPVAVTMAVLVFVVIGLYSLSMLSINLMPDINLNMAIVYTSYPNVGSAEVENLVTKNIESAVASVSGINSIQSQSSEGSSIVMVEFNQGTNMDKAVQDIKDNIDLYSRVIPDDTEKPMVIKLDMSMMPAAMTSVSIDGYDLIQTKKFIDDNVKSRLEAVAGVASVSISGAQDRIIEVTVDPEKVFGYNMSLSDVVQAVAAQNQNLPAGTTEGMNKKMTVRTMGRFKNVSDVEVIPLMSSMGQVIYLRDIASVKDTYSDNSTYARLNGENSISITISKESDANTVDVVDGITKVLDDVVKENNRLSYNMTMEQGSYIKNAISSVAESGVTGAILAIIILLLFLGSFRTSLVIGISMPISIVTTFIGMYFSGMTLNIVSLGGLALGVGMLVDNSVVVLENIFRRRTDYNEDAKTASMKGTGEIIGAVVASVLTTCIVYVPILFIDNMMAVMFKQLAFTIIFSQAAALLTTFLLIPMMSARIKKVNERNKRLGFILNPFNKLMDWFYDIYEKGLRWVLSHRKIFIWGTIGVFVLSLVVLSQLGMTLMATSDEGTVSVSIELPQGSKLEDTNKLCMQIENIVSEHEAVETVFSSVGSGGGGASMLGVTNTNTASITVTLKDKKKGTTSDVTEELRKMLSNITGATIALEAANNSMQGMSSDEVEFQFSALNEAALEDYVLKAEKALAEVPGITETSTSISEKKSEVRIKIDSARASRYGLNTAAVSTLVKHALDGTTASKFTEDGSEFDIKVVYPDNYVANYSELKNLRLKSMTGQWIALSDVADVSVEQGYSTLTRVDQKRVITLTGKLYGTNMASANSAFEKKLSEIEKPDGISKVSSGSYQVMIDAMIALLIAVLLGILLMYMVMAAQFENLIQPFIILFTIPLALIGVVIALAIARSPLSVVGMIGILMLMGIIVNNAIILIDFINVLKKEQPELKRTEVLVQSGLTRMRPILMTSLTSILGFAPMALATSNGSEMMQPLAVVLLGGLGIGTFLTLLVIPVVYSIVDDKMIKRAKKKENKKNKKSSSAQDMVSI